MKIDVWTVALDAPARGGAADHALLDADERQRAARFVFAPDRRRFIARRAALRRVLAARCGGDAVAIRYAHGPRGRPRVVGVGLDFSLTHSGEHALIALADDGRVGIDLERVDPARAETAMLRQHVDGAALAQIDAALRGGDAGPFFHWWTVVEAVAKARGAGIAEDMPPKAGAAWFNSVELADDDGAARRWHLQGCAPLPGCAAMLAGSAPIEALRFHTL